MFGGLQYIISLTDRVTNVANRIGGSATRLMGRMDGLRNRFGLTNIQAGITGGYQRMGSLFSSLSNGASNFVSSMGGVIGKASMIATAIIGIATAVTFGTKKFVDSAMTIQNAERVIDFASGQEGGANLAFLKQKIDQLNLPLVETYQSFQQVSGSFKDTKLAGQPMREIFEGVATASSAMNLSGDVSQGVFLALGQMMSKGKVSAEELTGQLGERLPGALNIAARAMGVSTSKLMDMMQNGELLSENFLPKFASELKRTFGTEAIKAAQSPQATLTRLSNKFEELKIKVGERLMPTFLKIGIALTSALERALPVVDKFFNFLSGVFAKVSPVIDLVGQKLQPMIEPLMGFLSILGEWWTFLYEILYEVVGMVSGAADWGQILGGVFSVAGEILGSVMRVVKVIWEILKPVLKILIDIAGWIVDKFGGIVLKVLEGVSWAFKKIANGVTWVYDKILGLLDAVGLLDKTAVLKVTTQTDKVNNVANLGALPTNQFGGFGAGGDKLTNTTKNTADKINQGGSRPINISIKYDKMIERVEIHASNLNESLKQVEEKIIESVLRGINGASQIATG
jgi:tape measure domain-containing protein